MANEKRLIDANAVIKEIDHYYHNSPFPHPGTTWLRGLELAVGLLLREPTVDAVEVCRCKDCKHCKKYRNRLDPMLNHQLCVRMDKYAFGVDEDDFCSYGERRTDES